MLFLYSSDIRRYYFRTLVFKYLEVNMLKTIQDFIDEEINNEQHISG